jgi:CelD/BcsL family acetyltransferase involved in cellulose biosynthesis
MMGTLDFLEADVAIEIPREPSATRTVGATGRLCRQLEASYPYLTGLFGSAPWIDALKATYGFDIRASVTSRGEEIDAAILFAEVEDIRGRRVLSLPFSDYLDPLTRSMSDWRGVADPLMELGQPIRFRCLHNDKAASDPRFERRAAALWHAADLTADEETLWARLGGSAHRNIRKAQENGLVIREGRSLQDVATFYELHFGVRKNKYRLFAQPFAFFENLYGAFAPEGRIVTMLAELDGVAVAGILFLIHGSTLYYKFNASNDLRFRPNDLLVWHGMQFGKRRGLTRLDFGLSDIGQPGLVRFKQKFATEERPITELRWSPPGYSDERGRQAGQMLQQLTDILTAPRVPDAVTRAVGDEIYPLFS